jgi:hypothetical protein
MSLASRLSVGLAAASLFVCVTWAPAASAYCRSNTCQSDGTCQTGSVCPKGGVPLYWKEPCVSFSVHKNAAPELSLTLDAAYRDIGAAFESWSSVVCESGGTPSINFVPYPESSCNEVRYNLCDANANVWLFRDGAWDHSDATHTLGLTTVQFNAVTGELRGADVELNVPKIKEVGIDVRQVILHEAGHFLGLDHSPESSATMYATPTKFSLMELSEDDTRGMCAIYPSDRKVGRCDADPKTGFTTECGDADAKCTTTVKKSSCTATFIGSSASKWGGAGLLLIGASLVVARRRRARSRRAQSERKPSP